MTDVGGAQSRNMINICTKYGFDNLIISGSYGEHRRHATDDRLLGVWHNLPTGE